MAVPFHAVFTARTFKASKHINIDLNRGWVEAALLLTALVAWGLLMPYVSIKANLIPWGKLK